MSKDCARDELLVRTRRKGDIEKLWPKATVTRGAGTDYLYRAPIKKDEVKRALANEVDRVTYANFKDSVDPADWRLHASYFACWRALLDRPPQEIVNFHSAAIASARPLRHIRRRRRTRRKK